MKKRHSRQLYEVEKSRADCAIIVGFDNVHLFLTDGTINWAQSIPVGELFLFPEGIFFFDTSFGTGEASGGRSPGHYIAGMAKKRSISDARGLHSVEFFELGSGIGLFLKPTGAILDMINWYRDFHKDNTASNRTEARASAAEFVHRCTS